jgi:hypothetical protein
VPAQRRRVRSFDLTSECRLGGSFRIARLGAAVRSTPNG